MARSSARRTVSEQGPRRAFGEAASPDASYLPLERYALIGDAGTAALISDSGSIDWLCLPRFDSNPVFGRILDPSAGHFSLSPSVPFSSRRTYLHGTAVLATTFTTPTGRATVHDFFAARDGRSKRRGLSPFRALIRRVTVDAGVVPFSVEIAPRDAFGGRRYRLRPHGARLAADVGGRSILADAPAAWWIGGERAETAFELRAGDTAFVSMSFSGRDLGVLPYRAQLAQAAFDETVAYWRAWSARASRFGGDAVLRSAIVLKLLTFAPSGGILAAPTTSLPESPGGERNWDYRFVWVRDASWTAKALTGLGYDDEADAYLIWAINAMRTSRPRIPSLSNVYGNTAIREREVAGLRGYRGARPVRVGNAAVRQRQLDNWGHLVDIAYSFSQRRHGLDRETWEAVSSLVRFAADHWHEPDSGMWEARSDPRHFVHSKVMAWVALDRGARLVTEFGLRGDADGWTKARERIRSAVLDRGIDPTTGAFRQVFGADDVDAALLLIGGTGFVPPTDERTKRTIDAVRARLGIGELVYRYRGADGLEGEEGAFVACSFWLAEALAEAGEVEQAEEVFSAVCERSNDVGLLPEEIDPVSGGFLGHMPQALSHIALINAATAIDRARTTVGDREARDRRAS
jgi:GH15 family glucan-1,4-alpha-glucosidase